MFKFNKPILQEKMCDYAYSGNIKCGNEKTENKIQIDKKMNIEKCFFYLDESFKFRTYKNSKDIEYFELDYIINSKIKYFKENKFNEMNLIEKFIIILFSLKNQKKVSNFYNEFNLIDIIENILEKELVIFNKKEIFDYSDFGRCKSQNNIITLLDNKYLPILNLLNAIELTKNKHPSYELENEIYIINHFIKNNYFENYFINYYINLNNNDNDLNKYKDINNYLTKTNKYTECISDYIFNNFSQPIYLNKF